MNTTNNGGLTIDSLTAILTARNNENSNSNNDIKNTYEKNINVLIDVLSSRQTDEQVLKFRDAIKTLKDCFNMQISTEFLKSFFDKNLNSSLLGMRINNILKRSEIKTFPVYRYYREQTTKKGYLFMCYKKQLLKVLKI